MMCSWLKNKTTSLVTAGVKKFTAALQNILTDSNLINEIEHRADETLFLPLTHSRQYRYIADVKEDDIYDSFVEYSLNAQTLGIDIKRFVYEHYPKKSKKARNFIIAFFSDLNKIIYDVLKESASPETRIILKGQVVLLDTILERINALENVLTDKNDSYAMPTIAVSYCANMQHTSWHIGNFQEALTNKHIERHIDLSQNNSIKTPQEGQEFWDSERRALIANFSKKVAPFFDDYSSFSIFGLAPIPLLILFGNCFANKPNIDIYQKRKSPSSWQWESSEIPIDIKSNWINLIDSSPEAILILSFSGKVHFANIARTLDMAKGYNILELSIESLYDDFLRSENQLNAFLTEYRKAISALSSRGAQKVHLFAAIPPAFAIAIGQAFNPNFTPQIVTYDYKQGQYQEALIIGEI